MSAPIGEWQWNRNTRRLTLSLQSQNLGRQLSGDWALDDLNHVLDGLSRQRLRTGLDSSTGDVGFEIVTASGDAIFLAGGSVDDVRSRGVILAVSETAGLSGERTVDLLPVFQPIVCLRSQRIEGFEALARWQDKDQRQHPVGDTQGLASSMLIAAADALGQFMTAKPGQDFFIQVNITSRDLADAQLVDLIEAIRAGHNLAPRAIRFELTEQDALRDTEQSLARLQELRDVGAGIVLDDFGSGHSSFQWLADLPADALKIDASLVQQLSNPRVETILEALTLMARRLGMSSTAEGVEDLNMMSRLRTLGFDHAQGFALGRPLPLEETISLLSA